MIAATLSAASRMLAADLRSLRCELPPLTLHGVTRPIRIPTKVTVTGNELCAQGEFHINRSDFNVKAPSALHGLVRVRDKLKFEFDIVGARF